MFPSVAAVLQGLPLTELERLAERHHRFLRPRWEPDRRCGGSYSRALQPPTIAAHGNSIPWGCSSWSDSYWSPEALRWGLPEHAPSNQSLSRAKPNIEFRGCLNPKRWTDFRRDRRNHCSRERSPRDQRHQLSNEPGSNRATAG
jgi:hypothetical protein